MVKTLYVGNLSYDTSEEDLRELFKAHGTAESIRVITDKYSGRSRGFAFVEMSLDSEADAVLQALDGSEFMGRNLVVSVAKPRNERGVA